MKQPKLSVIIPSYNKVKYIQRTLDSIVNQTYKNLEVIVQDGGSTDGTLEIVRKYASLYHNIISYESKKDRGQLDAINKGLKKATGDIVTFINADDEYLEGTFESVAGYYMENPDALWFAGKGIVVDSNDKEIAKLASWYKSFLLLHSTYYILLTTNFLMQPSVFIAREAYKKYGPFTGTYDFVLEYDLWLKVGKVKMPVVINKTLSKFRIEPDTKTKTMFERLLLEDEKIVKRYTKNHLILFLHKLHNMIRIIIGKLI